MNRWGGARGGAARWLIVGLGVLVLVVLAGAWFARQNPLALYEWGTRRALAGAGLELKNFDAEVGRLAYWEGGSGPTLILLHGVGDQAGGFQGVITELLERHRVVAVDLPGHGDSEPGDGPLSMTAVVEGVEELIGHVAQDETPTLVGHSMGAWVAIVTAHRNPQRVSRVIAINGGPLTGDRPDLSLTPADREAARTLMAALRDPASPATPDYVLDDIVRRAATGPIGRMMQAAGDFVPYLLDDRLGEVQVPVDLVWGESDRLLSLDYARRMLDGLPRARLTPIPACGHHPGNECPEKLATALTAVLSQPPPDASPDASEPVPSDGGAGG